VRPTANLNKTGQINCIARKNELKSCFMGAFLITLMLLLAFWNFPSYGSQTLRHYCKKYGIPERYESTDLGLVVVLRSQGAD
jgi:hypothetical protein